MQGTYTGDRHSKDKLHTTKANTDKHRVGEEHVRALKKGGGRESSERRKVVKGEGLSCHWLRQGQSLQFCQLRAEP